MSFQIQDFGILVADSYQYSNLYDVKASWYKVGYKRIQNPNTKSLSTRRSEELVKVVRIGKTV